jgi:adenine phosphoribosyltransferase|tara:strand:+ start:1223 stop:1735 length:513 start_codon:yes stop_codon:yes gene_type:complete
VELNDFIRDVPDFPIEGILFKDITPLLQNSAAFSMSLDSLIVAVSDIEFDLIAAPESRGFIFGVPMADRLQVPFAPIRKPGKLPYDTTSFEYELEYGTDTVEMHVDAAREGDRVLIVDDLLATGGTVDACCKLIQNTGAVVAGCLFLIELEFLNGRSLLGDIPVQSIIQY